MDRRHGTGRSVTFDVRSRKGAPIRSINKMNPRTIVITVCSLVLLASGAFSKEDVQLKHHDLNGFIHITYTEDGEQRDIYISRSHVQYVLVSSRKEERKLVHEVFVGFRNAREENGKAFLFSRIDEARSFAREVVSGRSRQNRKQTEQGDARRPATAADAKSEGNEKPKPESERRPQ